MAKKLSLLFSLMLAVWDIYGQDVITRSDGAVLKATILEIQPNQVRFRLFQQPDTLVYQISTQDVQSIQRADGTTKNFAAAAGGNNPALPFNYETSSGRNILWYYPFDLIFSNFTLAYERILTSGKVGLKIPLVIGLSPGNTVNYYDGFRENNQFGTGLEINFYPFGQSRVQYYFGPAIHFRSYRAYYYNYTGQQPELQRQNATMFAFALKNGMYYQFNKYLIISVDAGLGMRFFQNPAMPDNYYSEDRTQGYFTGNLHLGFRF